MVISLQKAKKGVRMSFRLNNFVAREFIKPAEIGRSGRAEGSNSTPPEVDIEAINDRIQAGDKEALKELDELGISYTLTQDSSGGYTVEYKYGGKNYTVRYYAPPTSTPSIAYKEELEPSLINQYLQKYETLGSANSAYKDKLASLQETPADTVNEPEAPEVPETETGAAEEETIPETTPDEPSEETTVQNNYQFDYSSAGVDEEADAKGFYDVNNIPEEKRARVLLGGGSDVDSGAWDDLFAELDKMKPQLLNYIKTQLEAKGYEYDAAAAEKYLNVFITGAVDSIGVPGKSKKYTGGDVPVLPADPTIEDLMNYLKDRIDNEISRYETTDGDGRSQLAPNGEPFDGERSYYSQDYYLTDVADYYLTDEEKEMKFVLEVVESDSSSYGTSSLDKVKSYIDTYAKHMEKVLRDMYPECTDAQIQTAINHAKSVVLNISDVVKKDGDGFYPIDDILAEFEKECYDAIEKQPMSNNSTSDSASVDDGVKTILNSFKEQVNSIKTPQVETEEPEETPAADESEETEETPDVTFDYTGVDSDTPVADMYNEDALSQIELLAFRKGYGNVDSAAWNDVFSELEKMKPQLLNYIKAQMEANGFKYDAAIAERYVEIYMTEALQRSVSNFSTSFWNKDFDMPENPTVSDLVNYVKDRIDYEIEKYTVKSTGNPYLDQALVKLKGVPFSDTTYMQDYYLMDIADYFLTDEEKEMKFVMEAVQNEASTHYTSDKNKLVDYVDTYAKHMEKVLKSKYPDLTDSKIDSIINAAKTYTLYMNPPEPDKEGQYVIDDLLKAFEEKCLEYAEK